jgi:hypothetical protein
VTWLPEQSSALPRCPPPAPASCTPFEKQRSREEDARALATGEKSREELQRENGHFAFANVRITLRGTKPLE